MRPTLHRIPICPFCQRVEVLMALKGMTDTFETAIVDIRPPRSEHILKLTGGTSALPVLELPDGRGLKESLVIMEYIEDAYPENPVRRTDPYERAIENLLVSQASAFTSAGYGLATNQDRSKRDELAQAYVVQFAAMDAFLRKHGSKEGPWLFERFGWAEAVFAPFFVRFSINAYYEGVDIPAGEAFDRVRQWRDACVAHPAAQQTTEEQSIKLYYDYVHGCGNAMLPPGRQVSSFTDSPDWRTRPMPPKDKYAPSGTDAELGLLGS